MTIDERLQALIESVELLTSLHRDLERETNEKVRSLAMIAEQNEVRAAQMMDAITRTGRAWRKTTPGVSTIWKVDASARLAA